MLLLQVPHYYPINMAMSQIWHSLKPVFLFCVTVPVYSNLTWSVSGIPRSPGRMPPYLSTHGLSAEQLNASRPSTLRFLHQLPVLYLDWFYNIPLNTVHGRGLLHLLSLLLPHFALLVLNYTGCFHRRWLFSVDSAVSHMVWNPAQICTFP